MVSSVIKKTGIDLISAFSKTVGTESCKRLVNGKPRMPEESAANKVKATKEAIGIIDHHYNWSEADYNSYKVSEYVRLLAPVAGVTAIGWVCLPVLAGATTFAIAGTGMATMVYGVANVTVIAGGASTAAKKVIDYHNTLNSDKNKKTGNDKKKEDLELEREHAEEQQSE